ncbi:MAG: response regulator [Planctomycetes bacterium]|nr:response regulator [Planctomycetota bacterium]
MSTPLGDPNLDRPRSILLVDDEPLNRDMLSRRLGKAGYDVATASDGADALAQIQSKRPDLVLLDLLMPGMSGLDVLRELRRTVDPTELPIVVATALHETSFLVEAMEAGANDFVTKPLDFPVVLARVESQLRAKGIADRNRTLASRLEVARTRLEVANRELAQMFGELEREADMDRRSRDTARQRLHSMAVLGDRASKGIDQDVVMHDLLLGGMVALQATSAVLYRVDGDVLRRQYAVPDAAEMPEELPLDGQTILARIAHGHSVLTETCKPFGTGTAIPTLGAPMVDPDGEVQAVILLMRGRSSPFAREDENAVASLAAILEGALQRTALTRTNIERMIRMASMRDPSETFSHTNRVAGMSLVLFNAWCDRHAIPMERRLREGDLLRTGAMLHDVGKVAIPDGILKKPTALTPDEYSTMMGHTTEGAALFSGHRTPFDRIAHDIVLHHHQRWNGRGYPQVAQPDGTLAPLRGEQIPLTARIVAIADVYDALLSSRRYKRAWSRAETVDYLRQQAGEHFDPELVEIAAGLLDELDAARAEFPESDAAGARA